MIVNVAENNNGCNRLGIKTFVINAILAEFIKKNKKRQANGRWLTFKNQMINIFPTTYAITQRVKITGSYQAQFR